MGWCTEVVWVFGQRLGGDRSFKTIVLTDCRMGLEVETILAVVVESCSPACDAMEVAGAWTVVATEEGTVETWLTSTRTEFSNGWRPVHFQHGQEVNWKVAATSGDDPYVE